MASLVVLNTPPSTSARFAPSGRADRRARRSARCIANPPCDCEWLARE